MANKEIKSFNKDHENIIKEVVGKKRALITTKMQKEAVEWCDCAETKGKHLYMLLECYCCL